MKLSEYIDKIFSGNQSSFAKHMNVSRQKVNDWIRAGWVVDDDDLCSPKRKIPHIADNISNTKDTKENI